jgi:hypothetical protein
MSAGCGSNSAVKHICKAAMCARFGLNLSCLDPPGQIDVSSIHFNWPQGGLHSQTNFGEAMAMMMNFCARCSRNMNSVSSERRELRLPGI